MEASESIVESYMRAVMNCFTISNIKLKNNKEIDILAVDPSGQKFHVECSVKTSAPFSKINDESDRKKSKARWRMSVHFFESEKFNDPVVKDALEQHGFHGGTYEKVIVASGWSQSARELAKKKGIELWSFWEEIVERLMAASNRSEYLSGNERVFQLIGIWLKRKERETRGLQKIASTKRERVSQSTQISGSSKYFELFEYMQTIPRRNSEVQLKFSQIEEIVGFKLAPSARQYHAWWANEAGGTYTHARAWLSAGWQVAAVSLEEEWVRFLRF